MKKLISLILPSKKPETVLQGVIRSSVVNTATKGFGYFRNLAIAVLLGFSYQTDGFFMALALLGIFLIFANIFDSVGVPQLVKARMQSEEEFRKLSGLLFTFTLTLSLFMSILAVALINIILKIPAGFSAQALEATKVSYLLFIPYVTFSFIFHHFGAVLRSQRRFTQYFVGELVIGVTNFTFTVAGLLLTKDFRTLPISFSVAQIVGAIYMLYVGREFIHLRFFVDDTTKKLVSQFAQLSALYGIFHLYILVDRAFASYLGEKAISALAYGMILASIPRNILRFENIAITPLAELGGSIEKLSFYLKKIALFSLPFTAFFFMFPWLPVKLFFGYGAFSKVDVSLTAEALKFYALSIPFMFFWPLIYRVFQIRENLLGISIVAIAGVIVNALLNYALVFYFKMGIAGICLGTFGAYVIICGVGYIILNRKRSAHASVSFL
ncbi:MAG: lipid II flippase MurJ [Thermodesulfovibrionaceae bacterium]